jgi:hypothetical protein
MSNALFHIAFGSFLALPVVALGVRFFRPRAMPWWAVALLLSVAGWILINATVYFYYDHLFQVVTSHPDPPADLVDTLNADGAKRVFALFFGWLYGPIYSLPFFLVFGVASLARKYYVQRSGHAA